MGAAFHDLVQATHPGFDVPFRRGAPGRILDLVNATLERVPGPTSVGESLSRHTLFSRTFDLVRIDTTVRWWVGSETFLGETPPARLSAWPELRRVHVDKHPRKVMELPTSGAVVDATAFSRTMTAFLAKTPLTDLATCHRSNPSFVWGNESLGLVGTAAGRALAMRALAQAPKTAVDASLGNATHALIESRAYRAVVVALDLLAERALVDAALIRGKGELPQPKDGKDAATFARCIGALVASEQLRAGGASFSEADRSDLLARLRPVVMAPVTRALAAELGKAGPRLEEARAAQPLQ
jgi:hypothetical protein